MRIGVIGCAGRMGRANLREVLETADVTLAGGIERAGSAALGQDLGLLAELVSQHRQHETDQRQALRPSRPRQRQV